MKLSATKPVRVSRAAVVFPVSTGALASTVRLDSKGALVLRKGKRKITFGSPQLTLAKKGAVTAKLGKRRVTLFSITPAKGKAMRINAATGRATLQSAKVSMPKATGKRIKKALKLKRTPSGSFGTVTVVATIKLAGGGTLPGGGGPGTPVGKPLSAPEPPLLARTAGAQDVVVNSITWNVRNSFIQYVNTQPAPNGGSYPSAGATAGPSEVRDGEPAMVYTFGFTPSSGWWDGSVGALYYSGNVNFRYRGHGIDFDTKNPEIEINGAASRAIFRLDGRLSTPYGDKRGVLLDLNPAGRCAPNLVADPAGKVIDCNQIPATIPADAGSSVFAGFYQPGAAFGDVSVRFTTP